MDIGEMKAGIKGAITSLLFWLVIVYVPVIVIDAPALIGVDIESLPGGDPARIGVLAFLWATLVVAAVFGVIAGIRGERQALWAQRDRMPERGQAPHPDKKTIGQVRPG